MQIRPPPPRRSRFLWLPRQAKRLAGSQKQKNRGRDRASHEHAVSGRWLAGLSRWLRSPIRCQRFRVRPHGLPCAERLVRSHAHGRARFSASERHSKAFDGEGAVAKLRVSKGVHEAIWRQSRSGPLSLRSGASRCRPKHNALDCTPSLRFPRIPLSEWVRSLCMAIIQRNLHESLMKNVA